MISLMCINCEQLIPINTITDNGWLCPICGRVQDRDAERLVESGMEYVNPIWLRINAISHTVQQLAEICYANVESVRAFLDRHSIEYMDYPIEAGTTDRDMRAPIAYTDPSPDRQCVYLIHASNGYTKVGISQDIQKRLGSLRSSSPLPLELIHTIQPVNYGGLQMERYLHYYLYQYRKHGEWFDIPANVLETVLKLNAHNFHKLVDFLGKNSPST